MSDYTVEDVLTDGRPQFQIDVEWKNDLTTAEVELQRDFYIGALLNICQALGDMGHGEFAAEVVQNALQVAEHPDIIVSSDGDSRKAMICGMRVAHWRAAHAVKRAYDALEISYPDAMAQFMAILNDDGDL